MRPLSLMETYCTDTLNQRTVLSISTETHQAFRAPPDVAPLLASITDSGGVDEGSDLCHVLEAQTIEHGGILFLQSRQVDVFL
jgi:hypothetical protein